MVLNNHDSMNEDALKKSMRDFGSGSNCLCSAAMCIFYLFMAYFISSVKQRDFILHSQ